MIDSTLYGAISAATSLFLVNYYLSEFNNAIKSKAKMNKCLLNDVYSSIFKLARKLHSYTAGFFVGFYVVFKCRRFYKTYSLHTIFY